MGKTVDYLDYLDAQVDIAPANSQEELDCAQGIAEAFSTHGLTCDLQEFDAPKLGRLPYAICALVLFVGAIMSGMDGVVGVVGLLLAIAAVVLLVLDHLGKSVLSTLGGTAKSQNVIGFHPASGDLVEKGNRPIVIFAHYDTPREDLLSKPAISPYRAMIVRACVVCVPVSGLAAVFAAMGFLPTAGHVVAWIIAILASLPPVLCGISAIAGRIMPCTDGANDNKASVAAMLSVLNNVIPMDDDVAPAPRRPVYPEPVPPEQPAVSEPVPEGSEMGEEGAYPQDAQAGFDDYGYDEPAGEPEEPVSAAAEDETYVAAPSAVGEPEPVSARPSRRAPAAVRHGRDVIESIGMLPQGCEVSYYETPEPAAAVDVAAESTPAPAGPSLPSFLSPSNRPHRDVRLGVHDDDDVVDASFESIYNDEAAAAASSGRGFDTEHAKEVAGEAKVKLVSAAHKGRSLMSKVAGKVKGAAGKASATVKERREESRAQEDAQAEQRMPGATLLGGEPRAAEGEAPSNAPEDQPTDQFAAEAAPSETDATIDAAPSETDAMADVAPSATPEATADEAADLAPGLNDIPMPQASPAGTLPIDASALTMDEEPTEQFEKDSSGLDAMPHDPSSTVPMPAQDKPVQTPSVDDPSWGTSTFRPSPNANMARRAVLFDLPDPQADDVDPLDSSRPHKRIDADEGTREPDDGKVVDFRRRDLGGVPSVSSDAEPAAPSVPAPHRIDGGVDLGSTQLYAPIPPSDDEPVRPPVSGEIGVISPDAAVAPLPSAAPVEDPSEKKHHLFGRKKDKAKKQDDSMGEWLGVGDDYDAKKDGRQIGSWDNLASEDKPDKPDGWKGGAAVSADLRDTEDAPDADEQVDEILHMGDDQLLCHDIWFVATGASALDHAGAKAFLEEHRRDIRGAFLVNLDCVGAGELAVLTREGLSLGRRADRRLVGLVARTAEALHVPMDKLDHGWADTDATPAMRKSVRAVTIMGTTPGGVPALSHTADDVADQIDEHQVEAVAQVVTEVIRRS